MEITQEPNNYTGRTIEPFTIDPNRFHGLYQSHQQFYDKVDTKLYQKIIDIWFEPLMQDPYYLFRTLGYTRTTNYSLVNQSPYNYYQLVTNVNQLKKVAHDVDNGINDFYVTELPTPQT